MALRAGSVGLGREAGLGARRGWTRRRRPLPRPGRPPPFRPGPPSPLPRGAPSSVPPRLSGGGVGCGRRGSDPARAGAGGTRGPPVGGGPGHSGGPAAAATLDASRALPVDRPSCGGRRGRTRGARRVAGARCWGARPVRPRPPHPGGGRGAAGGASVSLSVPRRRFPRRVRPPGRGFPRGASPRPAPSSRLRTGADQGNPTV